MSEAAKVCIIGAGPSGLVACKTFQQADILCDCFEAGSDIGGLWRYEPDNGRSVVYRSLHINSSKKMSQFSDFPMPDHFPDFPHHEEILAYLNAYTDHFNLRTNITFNTAVENISKKADGLWQVTLSTGEIKCYPQVIIATGHHWKPRFPTPPFPGKFEGETMHSGEYRVPDSLLGKDVLIVGIGNSAVDIACEAARNYSGEVVISTRRSAYIIPHYFFGRPIGELSGHAPSRLPFWMRKIIFRIVLWLARGNQEDYGIPKPDHPPLSTHPTVSQDIFALAGKKRIKFKPDIQSFDGKNVIFSDGSVQKFDLIIYCTGYKIALPFLSKEILDTDYLEETNDLQLYKSIVLPQQDGLFFLGFVQPNAAIFPTVEHQMKWIAAVIQGNVQLPNVLKMKESIRKEKEQLMKRFLLSKRHTIQIDYPTYIAQLRKDIKNAG